jgi:hypothetical protein
VLSEVTPADDGKDVCMVRLRHRLLELEGDRAAAKVIVHKTDRGEGVREDGIEGTQACHLATREHAGQAANMLVVA